MPSGWRASSSGASRARQRRGAARAMRARATARSRRSHFPCAGKGRKRAQLLFGRISHDGPGAPVRARDRVRRLGVSRRIRRQRPRQAQLPHPRRRAEPEHGADAAGLRHGRPGAGGGGEPAQSRPGGARGAQRRGGRQPRRHPAAERRPDFCGRAGGGRADRGGGGGCRRGAPRPRLRARRRPRLRVGLCTQQGGRRGRRHNGRGRTRSCCGPR